MERSLSLSPFARLSTILEGERSQQLPGLALTALAAVLVLGPLAFLAWKGLGRGLSEVPARMVELGLLRILGRVFLLALASTGLAFLWAVPLAWLTARSDIPCRRLIHWLAPLPLAIPPYVGALVYQILLAPGGFASRLLAPLAGKPAFSFKVLNIYGLLGAAWVLSLFTYPYIYLLVRAALKRADPVLEEVARSAGMGRWAVVRQVTLPLLRPALVAGGLLVFLYGWADFGVVSLLRVRTLTTIIYDFVQGTMDWTTPAALSVVLTMVTVAVLAAQLKVLGRASYTQVSAADRPIKATPLGRLKWFALGYVVVVLGSSFFLPLVVLVVQASRAGFGEVVGTVAAEGKVLLNSLWIALVGASVAILLALAVAWVQDRRRRGWGAFALLQVGYAIPGTALGLGMVGFFHAFLPWLYASPLIVALGYVCLFSTPALQAVKAALEQLPPSLEEAARGLGRRPLGVFRDVTLPLIRPGLVGGWVLVFILSMRELAATLIVRPPGFDTLPVRIWIYAVDVGPEPRAAALALVLVALIAVPWLIFLWMRPDGSGWGE